MKKQIISDALKKWTEVGTFNSEHDVQFEIELYKKLLEVSQVGPTYCFVFNPSVGQIVYHSDEMELILGYSKSQLNIQFILNNIHPEDLPRFTEIENAVVDFKNSLPVDKKMKYKSRYSYRLKKANGEYATIVQQSITIKLDENGGIQHNLVFHTDISAYSPSNKMKLSFIGLDGEPSFLDFEPKYLYKRANSPFTLKEKEILSLMIAGMKSKEIATTLNRSIHTIHVHRKNILSKSGCKTVNELISISIKEGWAN